MNENGLTGWVCSPTITSKYIEAGDCPDCKQRTRFICFVSDWYGTASTCLRCGRQWRDGEWIPLEFSRYARRDNIAQAKAAWRRHREQEAKP